MAYCYIEKKDFRRATAFIDLALKYEADHPTLLHEKGYLYSLMKDPANNYKYNKLALEKRPWITPHQQALAMRGMGYALIELGKLKQAEKMYLRSLKIEPNSKVALQELDYIRKLKQKKGIK